MYCYQHAAPLICVCIAMAVIAIRPKLFFDLPVRNNSTCVIDQKGTACRFDAGECTPRLTHQPLRTRHLCNGQLLKKTSTPFVCSFSSIACCVASHITSPLIIVCLQGAICVNVWALLPRPPCACMWRGSSKCLRYLTQSSPLHPVLDPSSTRLTGRHTAFVCVLPTHM